MVNKIFIITNNISIAKVENLFHISEPQCDNLELEEHTNEYEFRGLAIPHDLSYSSAHTSCVACGGRLPDVRDQLYLDALVDFAKNYLPDAKEIFLGNIISALNSEVEGDTWVNINNIVRCQFKSKVLFSYSIIYQINGDPVHESVGEILDFVYEAGNEGRCAIMDLHTYEVYFVDCDGFEEGSAVPTVCQLRKYLVLLLQNFSVLSSTLDRWTVPA